jgi:hypothetical protein
VKNSFEIARVLCQRKYPDFLVPYNACILRNMGARRLKKYPVVGYTAAPILKLTETECTMKILS